MIDRTRFRLKPQEFFPEPQVKDLVVLHFTAGSTAGGAFQHWCDNGASKVATPYLVDRGGECYEVFDPCAWAYHLGVSVGNIGHIQDRRSIGIEIVNIGPLKPSKSDPSQLCCYIADFTTPYCRFDQREKYTQAPFRGFQYFASFPDAQVAAVAALVADICLTFNIPLAIPPADKLTVAEPVWFSKFKGVCAHHNFRADKTDIGPAWPWARFIELAQARIAEASRG